MRRLVSFVVGLWLAAAPVAALGQAPGASSLGSQRQPIRISVAPAFQRYTDGPRTLSQASTRLRAVVPITSQLTVRAQGSAADGTVRTSGDASGDTTSVRGLDDVRASVFYSQSVGEATVVFSVTGNVPVGRRRLSSDELDATVFLSQSVYDFRVSGFGQGLNVTPGMTWAVPVSDDVVVGFGGRYHRLGGYRPVARMASDYRPGNQIEAFAGVDVRVAPTMAVSADVNYSRYGTDEVGGASRFQAGDRLAGTLQYLYRRDFRSLRVVARYAHRLPSKVQPRGASAETASLVNREVLPSEAELQVRYNTRLTQGLRLRLRASGHAFEETVLLERKAYGAGRAAVAVRAGDALTLVPAGTYRAGDVAGFEASLRLQVAI
jgi:hypothetical protein